MRLQLLKLFHSATLLGLRPSLELKKEWGCEGIPLSQWVTKLIQVLSHGHCHQSCASTSCCEVLVANFRQKIAPKLFLVNHGPTHPSQNGVWIIFEPCFIPFLPGHDHLKPPHTWKNHRWWIPSQWPPGTKTCRAWNRHQSDLDQPRCGTQNHIYIVDI